MNINIKKSKDNIHEGMYIDNSNLYKRKDIKDYEVYDIGYNSNVVLLEKSNSLLKPIYITIDNFIEFIYSLESNKLVIVDNSTKTNQAYILANNINSEEFIQCLDGNIKNLLESIRWEKWYTELKFNKTILKVLVYKEYRDNRALLFSKINNFNVIHITFQDYEEVEGLYEGLRILLLSIVKKIGGE